MKLGPGAHGTKSGLFSMKDKKPLEEIEHLRDLIRFVFPKHLLGSWVENGTVESIEEDGSVRTLQKA